MSAKLEQLVREVIDVTGADKPLLYEEDAPVLAPEAMTEAEDQGSYLIGLIGGKEVGKSAMVNALVGRDITQSTSFGEGTQIVTAYAHSSQAAYLRELLDREVPGKYAIVTHDIQHLYRQVLLDLPDIDSHWAEHVEVTRRMLRQMLFPLWMQSVEKYADIQPQQLLAKVAAGNAAGNFVFCLNKVDQLARQEGAEAVNELADDYAQRLMRVLNLPEPPRVFMVSAIRPREYDLPRLREMLGRQKALEEVDRGKQAAARQQGNSVLGWIRRQNLPQHADRLSHAEQGAEELLHERIGGPLMERCIPAMLDDPAHRLTVLDDCLKKRCARWPFITIIQGLAAPLAGMFRRRLAIESRSGVDGPEALAEAYLRPGGRELSEAIQTTFAQFQQSQPMASALYRERKLWESRQADLAAADLRRGMADTLARQQAVIARRVCGRGGVFGGVIRWILTIGALIWFPIAQPVLEAVLQPAPAATVRAVALEVVRALSVTFLLKTLTFMVLWFFIIWVIVRWDTGRRVDRQLQRWKVNDALDPTLSLPGRTLEWLDDLIEPIRAARLRMEALVQRADELESELKAKAA